MRGKVLILIAALVLGVVAAVFAARYIEGARARVEAQDQPVQVLVAQQDLPAGMTGEELADDELLKLETVPRRYVPDDAISSMAAITGKVLTVPLSKGEQVSESRFSLPSAAGLSFAVPEDFVAIALPNTADRGVAGLIRPGDSVVVYATFEPGTGFEEAVTKLVLRKARVLAVGGSTTSISSSTNQQKDTGGGTLSEPQAAAPGDKDVPGTITLALSPADAEKLVFAQEMGKVWLALLGSGTTEVPVTPGQAYPGVIK